jgi:preprotein translocase subunit SecD
MRYIHNIFILMLVAMFGLAQTVYATERDLTFHLVKDEYKVDDILQSGIDVDRNQYEVFANDNIIYVVNRLVELDDSDLACESVLGTSNGYDPHAASPARNQVINICFNERGQSKLEKLSASNTASRLAIVFQGKLLVAFVIMGSKASRRMSLRGMSSNEARRLDLALHKVCAWASNVSFRLVHPDREAKSEGIHDESDYESLTQGNVSYRVSKKVELDNSDFKNANILLTGLPVGPTFKSKPMELEGMPGQFNEEEQATVDLRAFGLRITLNQNGRRKLERLSENNIGRDLATVFEGRLVYVERIPGKTTSEVVMVNGLTYAEAKRLSDVINKGGHQ